LERILEIELFGESFKFKADAEDKYAEKVIDFLRGKVDYLNENNDLPKNEVNKFAQLLLVTLNICTEYFELKEQHDGMLKNIQVRSSKIVEKIDQTLK
jgi:cell division protein ZapA (FtsZ GTPase activity inhibitor)